MSTFSQIRKRIAHSIGRSRGTSIMKISLSFLLILVLLCITYHSPMQKENLNITLTPRSSIRTITGNVTLSGLNTTTATYGDDIILYGHAERWDGGGLMWVPYIGEIYLVVNDNPKTDVTTDTDGSGDFELIFTVQSDWPVTPDVKIEANTSQGGYDTFCYDQLYLDVDATAEITIEMDLLPGLEGKSYENYPVRGEIRLNSGLAYSGPSFEIEFWYGDISTGEYYKNITVQSDGSYSDFVEIRTEFSSYTLHWDGNDDVIGNTQQFDFNTINGIDVIWNLPTRIYANQTETIGFTLHKNTNPEEVLARSNVTWIITGPASGSGTVLLSVGGSFTQSFTFPIEGEYTLMVVVNQYHSEWGEENVTASWTVQTTFNVRVATVFSNLPWQFIVIGVVAAGIVVGIIFLQRWLMKLRVQRDRSKIAADIEARLKNVRLLYEVGRVKEALAYLYVTYTEIALFKYGIEKRLSQTTTEFAILMVKQFGQNPQNIYPFIQEIEQVVYGGYPHNKQVFNHIIELFARIYLELMEKPLPSFQLS
ncbi:MAG: hypothetical protein JW776_04175 [Candidatus Lokiarchaeota archaeon]|nr:hypothetical protein [Candidatus Lokiarchaeota archaeon]